MKRFSWLNKNIVGFGLTSFFNDYAHEMTTALLPVFIEQLTGGKNTAFILGLISGISDGASTGLKVVAGIVADKLKRYKPFLLLDYAITPLFVGLIGIAHTIWTVLSFKTIAWMARGMREPIRDLWLSKIEKASSYGRSFGFQRALDTLGAIAGPLTCFFLLKIVGIRTIFLLALIPGFFSVLSLWMLTEEKQAEQHNKSRALDFTFSFPQQFNFFLLTMLIFGLGNFNKLLLIYKAQETFIGESSSSLVATGWVVLLYAFFNVIRALAEFFIGSLSDYMNKKVLLAFAGFGLFGLTSIGFIFALQQTWFWLLIFAGAAISTGTISTVERAYAATLLPEQIRGKGFGMLQAVDGIGDLISSLVVGFLWSTFSPTIALSYAAVCSFIPMILILRNRKH